MHYYRGDGYGAGYNGWAGGGPWGPGANHVGFEGPHYGRFFDGPHALEPTEIQNPIAPAQPEGPSIAEQIWQGTRSGLQTVAYTTPITLGITALLYFLGTFGASDPDFAMTRTGYKNPGKTYGPYEFSAHHGDGPHYMRPPPPGYRPGPWL